MIIKNPKNGAEVKREVILGKDKDNRLWVIPVDATVNVPDEVGESLLRVYGFLEKVPEIKPQVLEVAEGFACSVCEFSAKAKIAVLGHLRKHNTENIEEAKSEKIELQSRTLYNMRAEKLRRLRGLEEGMPTGITAYGEGFVEKKL